MMKRVPCMVLAKNTPLKRALDKELAEGVNRRMDSRQEDTSERVLQEIRIPASRGAAWL